MKFLKNSTHYMKQIIILCLLSLCCDVCKCQNKDIISFVKDDSISNIYHHEMATECDSFMVEKIKPKRGFYILYLNNGRYRIKAISRKKKKCDIMSSFPATKLKEGKTYYLKAVSMKYHKNSMLNDIGVGIGSLHVKQEIGKGFFDICEIEGLEGLYLK